MKQGYNTILKNACLDMLWLLWHLGLATGFSYLFGDTPEKRTTLGIAWLLGTVLAKVIRLERLTNN